MTCSDRELALLDDNALIQVSMTITKTMHSHICADQKSLCGFESNNNLYQTLALA